MTAKEFVIGSIDKIVSDFLFVQCRYQFDEECTTHYVEVMPKGYMEIPNEITVVQNKIILRFIEKYPNQLLAFFSDDDFIRLDRVDYQNAGLCFKKGVKTLANI